MYSAALSSPMEPHRTFNGNNAHTRRTRGRPCIKWDDDVYLQINSRKLPGSLLGLGGAALRRPPTPSRPYPLQGTNWPGDPLRRLRLVHTAGTRRTARPNHRLRMGPRARRAYGALAASLFQEGWQGAGRPTPGRPPGAPAYPAPAAARVVRPAGGPHHLRRRPA